jgi:prepilin signal peptidase PulO-like enzyme (type II secretory pathway)
MQNQILNLIGFFFLGTVIGSFLSVLTFRMQTNQPGTWFGRSKCPKCKKQILSKDLIPLFSYLALKRKCRFCHKKISKNYFILELVTGITFAITYFILGNQSPLLLAGWLFIFSLSLAIAKYDLETFEVPPKLTIPLAVFSLLFSFLILKTPYTQIISAGLIGFAFYYLQFYFSKGTWTGLGDADFAGIIGILSGSLLLLQNLLISYILGATVAIYLLFIKKTGDKTKLAFVPFLVAGLIINVLFQDFFTYLFFPYL